MLLNSICAQFVGQNEIDWLSLKIHLTPALLSLVMTMVIIVLGVSAKALMKGLLGKQLSLYEFCKGGDLLLGAMCVVGVIAGDLILKERIVECVEQQYCVYFGILLLVAIFIAYFLTLVDYAFLEKNEEYLEMTSEQISILILAEKMQLKDEIAFEKQFKKILIRTSLYGITLLYTALFIDKAL
jgi:hypothetical protein